MSTVDPESTERNRGRFYEVIRGGILLRHEGFKSHAKRPPHRSKGSRFKAPHAVVEIVDSPADCRQFLTSSRRGHSIERGISATIPASIDPSTPHSQGNPLRSPPRDDANSRKNPGRAAFGQLRRGNCPVVTPSPPERPPGTPRSARIPAETRPLRHAFLQGALPIAQIPRMHV